MNHAFLIIAHDSPELLQRIIDRLEAPNHFVFVHYDKKYKCPPLRIRYGECISNKERVRVYWGGFSQIQAELILLRHALKYSDRIDYFHLLSGHDYPCVSNDEFDQFFNNVPYRKSFMGYKRYCNEEDLIKEGKIIDRRINKWYLMDIHAWKLIKYIGGAILNAFLPRKKYEGVLYKGSQWFSWHRSVVEWVLAYCNTHPEFLKRFHYTNCSDEVMFHTLLFPHIEELNIEKYNSLRYIDWNPTRKAVTLPLVLDERDYISIKIKSALFCRKCHIDRSLKLLDMLDKGKPK